MLDQSQIDYYKKHDPGALVQLAGYVKSGQTPDQYFGQQAQTVAPRQNFFAGGNLPTNTNNAVNNVWNFISNAGANIGNGFINTAALPRDALDNAFAQLSNDERAKKAAANQLSSTYHQSGPGVFLDTADYLRKQAQIGGSANTGVPQYVVDMQNKYIQSQAQAGKISQAQAAQMIARNNAQGQANTQAVQGAEKATGEKYDPGAAVQSAIELLTSAYGVKTGLTSQFVRKGIENLKGSFAGNAAEDAARAAEDVASHQAPPEPGQQYTAPPPPPGPQPGAGQHYLPPEEPAAPPPPPRDPSMMTPEEELQYHQDIMRGVIPAPPGYRVDPQHLRDLMSQVNPTRYKRGDVFNKSLYDKITPGDMADIRDVLEHRFGDRNIRLKDPTEQDLKEKVQGYYKWHDDMITLIRGKADIDTVDHESVHKAIGQYLNDGEIEQLYKDYAKVGGGKRYITKLARAGGYDGASWRTAAEEAIAEDFKEFMQHGTVGRTENVVSRISDWAEKKGLPASVVRIFQKLANAIDEHFGRLAAQDRVDAFYTRLHHGGFRDMPRRQTPYVEPKSVGTKLHDAVGDAAIKVATNPGVPLKVLDKAMDFRYGKDIMNEVRGGKNQVRFKKGGGGAEGAPAKPADIPANNPGKSPGIIKRVTYDVGAILDRNGTGGKLINKGVQDARNYTEKTTAKQMTALKQAGFDKISPENFTKVWDAIEGNKLNTLNPEEHKVADALMTTMGQIHNAAVDHGNMDIGDRGPNYLPHWFKNKDKGQVPFFKREFNQRFSNLERQRETEQGGYEKTKESIARYIQNANDRIGMAHSFGQKNDKLEQMFNVAHREGYDIDQLKRYAKTAMGDTEYGTPAHKVSSAIRQYEAVTSLQRSAAANIGQQVNTITVGGVKNWAKAAHQFITDPESRNWAEQTGVYGDHVLGRLQEQYAGVGSEGSNKAIRIFKKHFLVPAMQITEKWNRANGVLAGKAFAEDLLQKAGNGDKQSQRLLQRYFPNLKDPATATPEDVVDAAREFVKRTQFKVDPVDLTRWADGPVGKLIAQFRSFGYKQTQFMIREVFGEAIVHHNFAPLIRFLAVGVPVGYAIAEGRNAIAGQYFDDKNRKMFVHKSLPDRAAEGFAQSGGGGLPLSEGQNTARAVQYSDKNNKLRDAATSTSGPFFNDVARALDAGSKALQGDFRSGATFLASQTPIVGNFLATAVNNFMKGNTDNPNTMNPGELDKYKKTTYAKFKDSLNEKDQTLFETSQNSDAAQLALKNKKYSQQQLTDMREKYNKALDQAGLPSNSINPEKETQANLNDSFVKGLNDKDKKIFEYYKNKDAGNLALRNGSVTQEQLDDMQARFNQAKLKAGLPLDYIKGLTPDQYNKLSKTQQKLVTAASLIGVTKFGKKTDVAKEATDAIEEAKQNQWPETGDIKATNKLALDYIQTLKDMQTNADDQGKQYELYKGFWKKAVKAQYSDNTTNGYGFGVTDIKRLLSGIDINGKTYQYSKSDVDQMVELDDRLLSSGLIDKPKFSNKMRAAYGYGAAPTSKLDGLGYSGSGSGGGGGGRRGGGAGSAINPYGYTVNANSVKLKVKQPTAISNTVKFKSVRGQSTPRPKVSYKKAEA